MIAAFGMASYANAQALVFNSSVSVTIGGNNYTIDSGAGATTIVVGSSSITLTVPVASTAVFASLDRFDLDNDGSLTQTCGDSFSYLTITGAATVVITPDTSNVCEGGGSGGGGGGGGTTKPKTTTTTTTTPAAPASPSAPTVTYYNFGTTTLKNGSTGEAVKELQRFLNATMNLGLVVDGMFGPKTTAVMKQWQTDHGLVPDGLIGPLTKAQMNASVAQ